MIFCSEFQLSSYLTGLWTCTGESAWLPMKCLPNLMVHCYSKCHLVVPGIRKHETVNLIEWILLVTPASLHLGSAQVDHVLRRLTNPKRQLKGCTLIALRWPEVHQLILHGLEVGITKDLLEAYFRNEEKSGCTSLVDVSLKGRGIAILTLLQGSQGKLSPTTVA